MTNGLIVAIVGLLVVFAALVFLMWSMKLISFIVNYQSNSKKTVANGNAISGMESISGEVTAAISTALYLHLREIHDDEEAIVTIKKVIKPYSPWSSKIYSVHSLNRKFDRKVS